MIIGVTGSVGTGKTTVSGMFRPLGAYVIDADKIVHRILDKSARKRLAGLVFDQPQTLKKLCRIIHPLVKEKIFSEIKKHKSRRVIVIDAPLLVESGLDKRCDYLLVVKANLTQQLERASESLSLSKGQIRKRIKQQMPLRKKICLADFIIDNRGSIKNTEKQVKDVWEEIWKK
jgi:dephospho-CoA kinase